MNKLLSERENNLKQKWFGDRLKVLGDGRAAHTLAFRFPGAGNSPLAPRMRSEYKSGTTSKRLVSQAHRSLAGTHQGGVIL